MAAMLVSLKKGTAAVVSPTNHLELELLLMQTFPFVLVENHAHCDHVSENTLHQSRR